MLYSTSIYLSHHPSDVQDIQTDRNKNFIRNFILFLLIIVSTFFTIVLVVRVSVKISRTHSQLQSNTSFVFEDQITTTTLVNSNTNSLSSKTCQLPLYPTYHKNGTTIIGVTDESPNGLPNPDLKLLDTPHSIYLNSKNDVYVANSYTVFKYSFVNDIQKGVEIIYNGANRDYLYAIYINRHNDDLYILMSTQFDSYKVLYLPNNATKDEGTVIVSGSSSGQRMDLDENLNIYITESRNHRIVKWLAPIYQDFEVVAGDGTYGTKINQLSYPQGVYVDRETNDVYSAGTNEIRVWPVGAKTSRFIVKSEKAYPTRILRDCHGNFFVLNSNTVRLFGPSGESTDLGGTVLVGIEYAQPPPKLSPVDYLDSPSDIYLDEETGDLYVADTFRYRIQKFTLNKFSN